MTRSRSRNRFARAFGTVVNSGADHLDPVRARAVMGANRYFLLSALVCLPWALVIALADPPATLAPALTHVAMVCVWVICIDLDRRRRYVVAAVLGLSAPIMQFAYLAWVFSSNAGFALPLLTMGALAFVVFPPRQWPGAAIMTALATVTVLRTFVSTRYDVPMADVSEAWQRGATAGNVLVVVAIVSVLALFNNHYFVRERRRNDELLGEAEVAARTDSLTEVYNRRGISPLLSEVARSGEYSLALADLDRFKRINDRLGHAAGDVVLSSVARTLVESVGRYGSVARWGGEEFLVVMPGLSLDAAIALMESARRAMEEEYGTDAFLEPVTISAGVAHAHRRTSKEEALRLADAKLYEAKASGRNVVVGASVTQPAQTP